MARYLVFGASGGIGQAVVQRLNQPHNQLALVARSTAKLNALHVGTNAHLFSADATQPEEVNKVVQEAITQMGGLDGVVNCIGSLLLKPAHLTTPEDWYLTLRQNLDTSFFILKTATRIMLRQGGSVVLVSSAVSQYGLQNHEAIAAAKSGINGLVRAAAATYAKRGVRVNAVAPGLVRTPMTQHLTATETAEKSSAVLHALGRIGEPDDVAKAIVFLLDNDQSGWITGQVLGVDGGLSVVRSTF
ncbi:MAG: SDR family oxidoreductase [Rhodothermia bacterium]|nr:SDR family oxidoreductase [Rhodothermia bacterium]